MMIRKKDKKTKIRLMQWNVLADGLGEDGFLTTEFSPIHESSAAGAESYEASKFMKMVRQAKEKDIASGVIKTMKYLKMEQKRLNKIKSSSDKDNQEYDELREKVAVMKAKVDESLLVKLKKQFEKSPELKRVDTDILDWKMRYNRIKEIVLRADPDIITFQEMDHLKQFLEDGIFSSRYTCVVEKQKKYITPTYFDPAREDDLRPENYMNHLLQSRAAFAPKSYSHAYTFRRKRNKGEVDLDDDGVAVFWKREKFKPVELGYLQLPPESDKNTAAVAITLQHVTTNERINVLTTHLPSGDDSTKEQERLAVLRNPMAKWIARRVCLDENGSWNEVAYEADKSFDGVVSYVRYFAERHTNDSSRTVFTLDANSRPSFPQIRPVFLNGDAKETNVWRMILEGTGLESIWVQMSYLDSSGEVTDSKYPYIASVNKMRGPSSDQPAKIGEHLLELIDHVFTNATESNVVEAVEINDKLKVPMAPLRYETKEGEAELKLYPTSAMPSDHLPVLVDIVL
jgi:exonuclease III